MLSFRPRWTPCAISLGVGDQVPQENAKAEGHFLGDVQPQPNLTELDRADVGAVNTRKRSQLLLGKAARFPAGTNDPAKRFADGIRHGG
jgi:hypothetical protein